MRAYGRTHAGPGGAYICLKRPHMHTYKQRGHICGVQDIYHIQMPISRQHTPDTHTQLSQTSEPMTDLTRFHNLHWPHALEINGVIAAEWLYSHVQRFPPCFASLSLSPIPSPHPIPATLSSQLNQIAS